MTTQEFILQYRMEDVKELAFRKDKYPEVDMAFALDQIEGWQRARTKLPEWAKVNGIIYPPHISMEQCSSEATAKYKRKVSKSFSVDKLIDLTGGLGVDLSYMATHFKKAVYVERQTHLCTIAKHNLVLLGLHHAEVFNTDGVEFLHHLDIAQKEHTMIYLDPARRDVHGGKVYRIEDCTPNLLEIEEELLEKAEVVMVKLSPMLDIHSALSQLKHVSEVHIVSVNNECKELLFVLQKDSSFVHFYCVNDDNVFEYDDMEVNPIKEHKNEIPFRYLYEPNASIMKAGFFMQLMARYPVLALGSNSHLFVSSDEIVDFPGRRFQIRKISSMNKKELKNNLSDIHKANITVRNFPLSVANLRKRLKIKDGGDDYIFATTIHETEHVLIICSKL